MSQSEAHELHEPHEPVRGAPQPREREPHDAVSQPLSQQGGPPSEASASAELHQALRNTQSAAVSGDTDTMGVAPTITPSAATHPFVEPSAAAEAQGAQGNR